LTRRNRFNKFIRPQLQTHQFNDFIMSDAQAAQVTENGVPPTTQEKVEETLGFKARVSPFILPPVLIAPQVFAGNLAYSTTEDGLKAFFDPVKDDV
jgi:hypothetical protein